MYSRDFVLVGDVYLFGSIFFLCSSHSGLSPLGSVAAKSHPELQNVPSGERGEKNAALVEFQNVIQTTTATTTRRLEERFQNWEEFLPSLRAT